MKKILIWYLYELENSGGPKGYLYNIHKYLTSFPNPQITFLVDLITPIKAKKFQRSLKQTFFSRILNDIKQILNFTWRHYNYKCSNLDSINIEDFDIVHIHDVAEYFRFKNKYPTFSGKVVLTNHSPCPWAYEMMSPYDKFVHLVQPYAIYKECQAYKEVDYLMFPCKNAREPYEVNKSIKNTFTNNENKFFYVPSAILDFEINEAKMQHFSDLGIPDNAFVITYFGRHNSIKGYDILKTVGEVLLDKYPNLYILCAGQGDILPLNHKRWIELGFINNTQELLHQADLYISANRETYFDLVVLEILRSSTKALLSNTGGNKYFKKFDKEKSIGLDFFDVNNMPELLSKVEGNILCKQKTPDEYKKQCQANRQLFLDYFTIDKYINRYLDEINRL